MTKLHLAKLRRWLFILFFAFFVVSNLFASQEDENVADEKQTEKLATDRSDNEQVEDSGLEQEPNTLTEKELKKIEKNTNKMALEAEKEKLKEIERQRKEREKQEKEREKQEKERRKQEEKEEKERKKEEEKEQKRIEKEEGKEAREKREEKEEKEQKKEEEKEQKKIEKEEGKEARGKREEKEEKERRKEEEKEQKRIAKEEKKGSRKKQKEESGEKEEEYYTGYSEGFENGYGDEYEDGYAQDFGGFYQEEGLETGVDSVLLAQETPEPGKEKQKTSKESRKGKDGNKLLKLKVPNCYYKNSVVYKRGDFEFTYELGFFVHYFEHRYHHKKKLYDVGEDPYRKVAKQVMNLAGNTMYRKTNFNEIIDSIGVLLNYSVEEFLDSVITELNLEYLATGEIKIKHKKKNQTRIYAKVNPSDVENQTLGNITFYTRDRRNVIEHLDASPFEQYLPPPEEEIDTGFISDEASPTIGSRRTMDKNTIPPVSPVDDEESDASPVEDSSNQEQPDNLPDISMEKSGKKVREKKMPEKDVVSQPPPASEVKAATEEEPLELEERLELPDTEEEIEID